MREIFLETYLEDAQKVYNKVAEKLDNEENMKIHDEFWNSLNREQQDKFRKFEMVLASEHVATQEEIYIYALKKGIAMGFLTGLEFK